MTEPVRRPKRIEVTTEVAVCPARGCWREFAPTRSDQVYCSGACRRRAHADRERSRLHEERNACID